MYSDNQTFFDLLLHATHVSHFQFVKKIGYANDKNFVFVTHPTGGLSSKQLLDALAES